MRAPVLATSFVVLLGCAETSTRAGGTPVAPMGEAPTGEAPWTRTAIPNTHFSVEGPESFTFQPHPAPGQPGATMDVAQMPIAGGRLVIMSRPLAPFERGTVEDLTEGEMAVLLMPLVERHEEIAQLFFERSSSPAPPAVRIGVYRKAAREARTVIALVDRGRFLRLFAAIETPNEATPAIAMRFLDSLRIE